MVKEKCMICGKKVKGDTLDYKYYNEKEVGYICPECKENLYKKGLCLCEAKDCSCGMSDYAGCIRKEDDILSAYDFYGDTVNICKDLVDMFDDIYQECPECGTLLICDSRWSIHCPICGYSLECE